MELQALASSFKFFGQRCRSWQQRLASALPFLCLEDLILMVTWCAATPELRSLTIGAGISLVALLLLFWVQGYQQPAQETPVIGPYRFVRHPMRLSLWLLAIGFSLGSRSFPGLLVSLGLLPFIYHLDVLHEEQLKRRQNLASFRYGRFVPALVPTIFPYKREDDQSTVTFSWKRGLIGIDSNIRRRLGRLILGWLLVELVERNLLPHIVLPLGAGLWLGLLIVRTLLHRKTIRVVFT